MEFKTEKFFSVFLLSNSDIAWLALSIHIQRYGRDMVILWHFNVPLLLRDISTRMSISCCVTWHLYEVNRFPLMLFFVVDFFIISFSLSLQEVFSILPRRQVVLIFTLCTVWHFLCKQTWVSHKCLSTLYCVTWHSLHVVGVGALMCL